MQTRRQSVDGLNDEFQKNLQGMYSEFHY
jgi:hypothetical protein